MSESNKRRRSDVALLTYDQQRQAWEQHAFRLLNPESYARMDPDSSNLTLMTTIQILHQYADMRYYIDDGTNADALRCQPFITRWLNDPDIRTINALTYAPPPAAAPPIGIYNTWTGLAVQQYKPIERIVDPNSTAVRCILEYIDVLCGHDADAINFIMNWLAHMVQRPGEKPAIAVLLRTQPSDDAGCLVELLQAMLGREKCLATNQLRDLAGSTFNSAREGRLLVVTKENGQLNDFNQQFTVQQLIKSRDFSCYRSGFNNYNMPCCTRFLILSDRTAVAHLPPELPNFAIIESASLPHQTLAELRNIIQDPHHLCELYLHMRARDITGWATQRPVARDYIRVHNYNRAYVQRFLIHYVLSRIHAQPQLLTSTDKVRVGCIDLISAATLWQPSTLLASKFKFGHELTKLIHKPDLGYGFRGLTKIKDGIYVFQFAALVEEMLDDKWITPDDLPL
jgi:hypothetical protein